MDLNDIKGGGVPHPQRKRIGRGPGSGRGKTAGRGHKGHGARSGWSRRLTFEGAQIPLFRKVPVKGFNNGRFKTTFIPVNVGQLEVFDDGAEIDAALLDSRGIARGPKGSQIKLLGSGELTKKVTIKVHAASKSALEKISKAGGSVEIVS